MNLKRIAALVAVLAAVCLLAARARMIRKPANAGQAGAIAEPKPSPSPQAQRNTVQNDVHATLPDVSASQDKGSIAGPAVAAALPASNPTPDGARAGEGAGWKTYSSSEYGFEIRYPADWLFRADFENNYGKPPSGHRAAGYAGELRNLFDLEKEGANQPDEGGGDFEDGAVVAVKITGTSGVVESWTLTPTRPWYLITATPEEWVKQESSPFGGNHVNRVAVTTNEFTGVIEIAHDDANPEKIWGEAGGAYRVLPSGRVLLISWERMNVANDLSYQNYFLPMLSSFKPVH